MTCERGASGRQPVRRSGLRNVITTQGPETERYLAMVGPRDRRATGPRDTSRRAFLRTALGLVGGALTVAGVVDIGLYGLQSNPNAWMSKYLTESTSADAGAQATLPDYQDVLEWLQSVSGKISGQSIDVSLEEEFAPYALRARGPDFLRYSHVAAGYNLLPYLTQLDDMQLAVSTQSPSYDVFTVDNQNTAAFDQAIIPPEELISRYPELTYPKYDIQDFSKAAWSFVGSYPPASASISSAAASGSPASAFSIFPFDSPVIVFFYRKDIYDKLGLQPPATWDEYYEQAPKLMGSGTPYATVTEGNAGVSIVYEYLNHLASFGGTLWNIDGNEITPDLESDQCLAALENFVRFEPFADPGSFAFTWTDQFSSLATGTSATALLWCGYYEWLNDPVRSPVAPGYFVPAINPAGPIGSFSTFGGSGMGVSRFSRHPEAAYVWIQWATCKGTQEQLLLDSYHVFPSRSSVLDAPPVLSAPGSDPAGYAAFSVAKKAFQTGVTALTPFPNWFSVLVPLSKHLNRAWKGEESPSEALGNAQAEIEQGFPALTFN